jgi:hypothetical protein
MDTGGIDASTTQLWDAVRAIQRQERTSTPLESLYKTVESLCLSGQGGALYETLQEVCQDHLRTQAAELKKYPLIPSMFFHSCLYCGDICLDFP